MVHSGSWFMTTRDPETHPGEIVDRRGPQGVSSAKTVGKAPGEIPSLRRFHVRLPIIVCLFNMAAGQY